MTRRELLAIVHAVKHFHHYLYGIEFLVRTDHGALTWLMNFKNPEGQMARWLEILGTYNFKIQHRPGRRHGNADGMSRRPCDPCTFCSRKEELAKVQSESDSLRSQEECSKHDTASGAAVRVLTRGGTKRRAEENHLNGPVSWYSSKTKAELHSEQLRDSQLSLVIEWKETGAKPPWAGVSPLNSKVKAYWGQWERLCLRDGVLYRKWFEKGTNRLIWQLVIPDTGKDDIIKGVHDEDEGGGHLGIKKTLGKLRSRVYWVGLKADVLGWCKRCELCQARQNPHRKYKSKMKQYIVGGTMERVAMDILGPLPETYSLGNKYVLVVTDYFTRWVEAYPLPNQEAWTVARSFVKEFICRYGVPLQVHTDQGRQFESNLFREICDVLGMDTTRTTPFHPQSDGLVERFNQTLEAMLSKVVREDQTDWDEQLPLVMMAYRSAVQESTGQSPCRMMLGREVRLPIDMVLGPSPDEPVDDIGLYAEDLQCNLWQIHNLARKAMINAGDRQKRQYDVRANVKSYKRGDAVWLHDSTKRVGRSPKLKLPWVGPFIVVDRLADFVYRIQRRAGDAPKVVHHDRLKPYHGAVDRSWQGFIQRGGTGGDLSPS